MAGQPTAQRKRSEADRGDPLSGRRHAHPKMRSRRKTIGRLRRRREAPWFWGLDFLEWQRSDGPQYGNAANREAAMKAVRGPRAQAEGARTSLMRLAQRCERVEDVGDLISDCYGRRKWPKLRLDISQCVAEIAMCAGKPLNIS